MQIRAIVYTFKQIFNFFHIIKAYKRDIFSFITLIKGG